MFQITPQFAILLDGSFLIKKLRPRLGRFPTADDIENACGRIRNHTLLKNLELLRIYFYDAPPAYGSITNPVDGAQFNLSRSHIVAKFTSLHDTLGSRVATRRVS